MILPILPYGNAVLRQQCQDIDPNYPDLDKLIDSMWETMYNANGCGLAASQVGVPINLFIVDTYPIYEAMEAEQRERLFENGDMGIKKVFINAKIIDYAAEEWKAAEGCLSIPGITGVVKRACGITIEYTDEQFDRYRQIFTGTNARTIQHEYDHTRGILFPDLMKPLPKKIIHPKLRKISNGNVAAAYPMLQS